jgi:ferredoxin
MKAFVDDDRCRGHAACCTICPEVFAINDDGYASVLVPEIAAEFTDQVRLAAESCPERAITVS